MSNEHAEDKLTRSQILVEPTRWVMYTFTSEEVQELVHELQDIDREYEVRPVYQKVPLSHWGGHPIYEVIAVWVPWADLAKVTVEVTITAIVVRALDWLLERPWLPHPLPNEEYLSKGVHIYGPHGEILQTVYVERPDAEPTYGQLMMPDDRQRNRSELRDWLSEDHRADG